MSLDVMLVVLFAAVLHAGWNALVRASSDKFIDTSLLVWGAGALAACLLPFVPLPASPSWPYLAASVLIHVVYFTLVAFSYRAGDLSFVYPIMRGSAPAFSAVAAVFLLNELPSPGGWAGVVMISSGVILLAGDSWRAGTFRPTSAIFALANACVIVLYTLVDAQGARLSGQAFSYTGWMFLLTAALSSGVFLAVRGRRMLRQIHTGWRKGLLGGACTLASYGLALWAMTQAPVAAVAALRETSVVFAAIFAAVFLKETISRLRYLSILTVSAGAVAIKVF
ncbi:MAG: EamA family transporter [Rhodocyclaceae bacterium]|nr:MAG: EamA family transporter [Rhodocyclaceae bacterium]